MSDDASSRKAVPEKRDLLERGYLRLALEDMGDVFPRLTRLVVNSFASGQINQNDLADCRRFIDKIYCEIHFQKYSPAIDPKHINNSATKIHE